MASIFWSDVTSLPGAATYASVSVAAQTAILAVANQVVNVSGLDGEDGYVSKLARCNFAAHIAAMEIQGAKGPVTAESMGAMSRSYAAPMKSLLEQTSFGRMYLMLIRPYFAGPIVP